jgi:isocitrate dehydrogenase
MRSEEKNKTHKGEKIISQNGKLITPDSPIIPVIVGDGIGQDIWRAAKPVLDNAVLLAYENRRHLHWFAVSAGLTALDSHGSLLPSETIDSFHKYRIGLKGPLSTPVGGGFQSINVTLRRELDLYVCMRPIVWIPGSPSPVRYPERVNMIIFRENTEDIYAGIELKSNSQSNREFMTWLKSNYPEEFAKIRFPNSSGISIKPISREGSQRLVRAAVRYALKHNRKRLTLVHKGNIMKFSEGAFTNWGYDLVEDEFEKQVFTHRQWQEAKKIVGENIANLHRTQAMNEGKLFINDVITDAAFEQTLTRPEEFDIIATTNLNGDYLSDALAAQIGGLGIAPGVNLNQEDNIAIFEATHGTAPTLAGKNIANPCSLILSGAMLLDHIGWKEAADLVRNGIRETLAERIVTQDFYHLMDDGILVSTTDFGNAIIRKMQKTINALG